MGSHNTAILIYTKATHPQHKTGQEVNIKQETMTSTFIHHLVYKDKLQRKMSLSRGESRQVHYSTGVPLKKKKSVVQ